MSYEEKTMLKKNTGEPTPRKPLRLWPGVVAAVLCLVRYVVPIVVPDALLFAMIGGAIGVLAIVVWWLLFSRAPWLERVGTIVLMIVALFATPRFLHESVAKGNMGFQFYLYAIPALSLAFVVWAVASRRLSDGLRRATMVATILLACGAWTLVRSKGITGEGTAEFAWRWAETPEEQLLAQAGDEPLDSARGKPFDSAQDRPTALPTAQVAVKAPDTTRTSDEPAVLASTPTTSKTSKERLVAKTSDRPAALATAPAAAKTEAEWPGFRGRERDGIIRGVRIETNWSASPPVELWRRPIGPGVSSFAVRGDLFYTHEQRGDDEVVACYNVTTGEPVWMHRDAARFWDAHVGTGPRATPALRDGRVYTFGATGILNALDANDGAVLWSRNAASDTDAKLPTWGFVSSPLVANDLVIVHAGKLVAYELATGNPRWFGPAKRGSYSSPHLLTIDGVPQIVLLNHAGATSLAPVDGKLLWEHPWPGIGIVQPLVTADGDFLISMIDSMAAPIGMQRIAVANGPGGWTVEKRWSSTALKPSFSPIVVHQGHAFGFDGSILACIDVADGKRKWKGGRYGSGQLVLLPDQDLLLVLSEKGELALVAATPEQFKELARFPAIDGKTWNYPVLVGDVLLVRNGQEMAAFRLSLVRS
jgi:outer membrane protein assembly factor BamB